MIKVLGCPNLGKTVSILLRGSNGLVLEEADRSLHDALCVVRALVKKRSLVPGGACVHYRYRPDSLAQNMDHRFNLTFVFSNGFVFILEAY